MSNRRGARSRFSNFPPQQPEHCQRSARTDPHLDELHRKFIFYSFRSQVVGDLLRERVSRDVVAGLYATAMRDFSDTSRYPGNVPATNAAEATEFWRKCSAVCPAEGPGEDPLGWARQRLACSLAGQCIMNEELPKTSAANTNLCGQWMDEVSAMIANKLGVNIANLRGPRPGVFGQTRLLDWVGFPFRFTGKDKRVVEYLVEDGGTTVSQGPFFILRDKATGMRKEVSANEFEQMVKGLAIPIAPSDR
ncbi:hypothetical protein OF83DRAFT_1142211 [Amylostereum chailletii]|nr:hypothetical protein OF83DRAFT_1142211 [Amylostereum chailletii]